jgi:hypothetical protein
LKRLAKELFGYTNEQIDAALKAGEFSEIAEVKSNDKQDTKIRT